MSGKYTFLFACIRANLKLFEDANSVLYQCHTIGRYLSPWHRIIFEPLLFLIIDDNLKVVILGLANVVPL